jgi:UvrD/REP helicase N-terminal domain
MPESRIDDLNSEQLRAATAGEGPVLTIAGAGTGKTKLLRREWLGSCRRGSIRAGSCFSRSRAGLRTRFCAGRGEPWVMSNTTFALSLLGGLRCAFIVWSTFGDDTLA